MGGGFHGVDIQKVIKKYLFVNEAKNTSIFKTIPTKKNHEKACSPLPSILLLKIDYAYWYWKILE